MGAEGIQHSTSKPPCYSAETTKEGETSRSPSWLRLVAAPASLRVPSFLGSPPLRVQARGSTKRLRATSPSFGPPEASGCSRGLAGGLGSGENVLHQDPPETATDTNPSSFRKTTGGCSGSTTWLPSRRGNSSTAAPLDSFGVFTTSPRSLRAEPDMQRLASLCRSSAIAAPVGFHLLLELRMYLYMCIPVPLTFFLSFLVSSSFLLLYMCGHNLVYCFASAFRVVS